MNWSNYADVLAQLRAAGLLVDSLEVGGFRRCAVDGDREKRGWYKLHELRLDGGDLVLVGTYGVWRGNEQGATKIELRRGTPLSADQRAALKASLAADRKAEAKRRAGEAARAARRAAAAWAKMAPDGESEYLRRKCVQGHGVRYSGSGAVVVPMLDAAGQIHGLQAIYPSGHPRRKRLGRDKDFWPPGVAKQGKWFQIGSPVAGSACLLCEGYATGASLYEATGLPVAIAFDAGNLLPVAQALGARWSGLRVLVCADDDYLGKCPHCGAFTGTDAPKCTACEREHGRGNAGVSGAAAAALAVDGAWCAPQFAAERPRDAKGPTDFNDLHVIEGLQSVRAQIEGKLGALKWRGRPAPAQPDAPEGGGEGGGELRSVSLLDELFRRFVLVYDAPDTVFDSREHVLVPLSSMRNLCSSRQLHRQWMESVDKRIVRMREVGFDPTERDEQIRCNLWGGWPTRPRAGSCDKLLELGEYLCSNDPKAHEMWAWLQRWLAYPIQNPGAKMKTAVIVHGPQGTGKNLFFEAVLRIYGEYGRIVDQDAIEDKHNDWMSRALMLVADEVVARQEMWHSKNKLKNLITGDWIRINPKHIASYRERNHVQVVFLSNEVQPAAIERDDRRHAVIWTPPKHTPDLYHAVLREIEQGGIQALHHYLLGLPLADFGPATLPPMTQAKRDLVELGLDSSERFYAEWRDGFVPLPVHSCRTEDLYAAYRYWCQQQGVAKPAQLSTFVGTVSKQAGVERRRCRHLKHYSLTHETQSVVITPPGGPARPEDKSDLTAALNRFAEALKDWRDEAAGRVGAGYVGSGRAAANGAPRGGEDGPF